MPIEKFWFYWSAFLGIILSRYFLFAGGTYLLLYSALRPFLIKQGVQFNLSAQWAAIYRDVKLSILSAVVFACCAAFILLSYEAGTTLLYTQVNQRGWIYLGASFFTVLILHDTYFYFTHRLLHHPRCFKWLHAGHHRSKHPTPWTSFAFDPAEAFIQASFLMGIVFVVPLHFTVLIALLLTMTVWAVVTHLGFQLLPPAWNCCGLNRWLVGSQHHLLHHRKYNLHYGLYFTLWDRLLGTHDPGYDQWV